MNLEPMFALAEKYPELTAVLIATVVWPTITGLASFGYHKAEERFPAFVALLRAAGLDMPRALKALRAAWPKRLPPPPPSVVLLLALLLGGASVGCAASELLIETLHDVEDLNDAQTQIANEALPCFGAEADRDELACKGDAVCVATVRANANRRADLYAIAHAKQCKLNPLLVGCAAPKVSP